jgi:hypothetical protein
MDYMESPSVSHECEICGDAYVSDWPVTVLCWGCRAALLSDDDNPPEAPPHG